MTFKKKNYENAEALGHYLNLGTYLFETHLFLKLEKYQPHPIRCNSIKIQNSIRLQRYIFEYTIVFSQNVKTESHPIYFANFKLEMHLHNNSIYTPYIPG